MKPAHPSISVSRVLNSRAVLGLHPAYFNMQSFFTIIASVGALATMVQSYNFEFYGHPDCHVEAPTITQTFDGLCATDCTDLDPATYGDSLAVYVLDSEANEELYVYPEPGCQGIPLKVANCCGADYSSTFSSCISRPKTI